MHLGSKFSLSANPGPEVVARAAIIRNETGAVRRRVLKNPDVAVPVKVQVVKSVVTSSGLYNSATWPKLTPRQHAPHHRAMMTAWRMVANEPRMMGGISDAAVVLKLGVLMPRLQLVIGKCVLFATLVQKQYYPALTILAQERNVRKTKSWLGETFTELNDLARRADKLEELRDAALKRWVQFAHKGLKFSKTNIVAAMAQASAMEAQRAIDVAKVQNATPVVGNIACPCCAAQFDTVQSMSVHAARKHKSRRVARRFANGSTCWICMQRFGNRLKLVNHLSEKGVYCFINAALWHTPLEDTEVARLDDEDRIVAVNNKSGGFRPDYSPDGVEQLYGPIRQLFVPKGYAKTTRHVILIEPLRMAIELDLLAREANAARGVMGNLQHFKDEIIDAAPFMLDELAALEDGM